MNPNPEDKKQIRLQAQDWAFLIVLVLLFLMVIVKASGLGFAALFESQISPGMTYFSLLSFSMVFLGGILWGSVTYLRRTLKLCGQEFRKQSQQFPKNMLRFVGIRKVNFKGVLLIILAFGIGVLFNLFSNLAIAYFNPNNIQISSTAITPYTIVQFIIANPIAEEFTYRALFIGFFLTIFGRNRCGAVIALVMSSFVFGFMHLGPTWMQLTKTAGGLMLGTIYLTRWGRNYLDSLSAHIGLNVVGIFTVIGI